MRPIPSKLKARILADPFYKVCARADFSCTGRITWEHAFIYAGKQINEVWAIIPLCAFHHLVDEGMDKAQNQLIALSRATPEDLAKYQRINWSVLRKRLEHTKVENHEEKDENK